MKYFKKLPQVERGQTMNSLKGKEQDLEVETSFYRKPMKLSKERGDVIKFRTPGNYSGHYAIFWMHWSFRDWASDKPYIKELQ